MSATNIGWWFAIPLLSVVMALPATAQFAPPSTSTLGGHFLAPAPSVTSIGGRFTPNPLPSVTSLPNYGFQFHGPYHGYYRNHGYWNAGGWGYVIPYYYPVDTSAYGYDYVGGGGPDMYSGPPPGPNDPSLHMIVEQPPARPYGEDAADAQAYAPPSPPSPAAAPPPPDVKPADPTVLVFRNGRQQEVTNYAIMGDSLYVFDQGRKKIALADLDIPATIKANDDRGIEFRMPPAPKKKTTTTVPQSASPNQNNQPPANIAAAMP